MWAGDYHSNSVNNIIAITSHCVTWVELVFWMLKCGICLELFQDPRSLRFLCTSCYEQLVCSDCLLLGGHKHHQYILASAARPELETMIEEFDGLVQSKESEFSKYIEKASEAEGKALEYSELMKSDEVNNVFDGIVASVEAQRNEALQSVSQGVKEIWSQKEMMEVSLAQLDSFTRFAENTHKCRTL